MLQYVLSGVDEVKFGVIATVLATQLLGGCAAAVTQAEQAPTVFASPPASSTEVSAVPTMSNTPTARVTQPCPDPLEVASVDGLPSEEWITANAGEQVVIPLRDLAYACDSSEWLATVVEQVTRGASSDLEREWRGPHGFKTPSPTRAFPQSMSRIRASITRLPCSWTVACTAVKRLD